MIKVFLTKELSMSPFSLQGTLVAVTVLSSAILGGGVYECVVVDPSWPKQPELIQPFRGGISRGRFWLPVHALFEILLVVCLIRAWIWPSVRFWLLLALACHATARLWSALDFIPKALAFEKAATVNESSARRWTRRSRFRLPMALLTVALLLAALGATLPR